MSLFFIHGGPGFNSQPDRLVLSKALANQGIKSTFWDEPSALRPHGSPFHAERAYTHWLNDLREALIKESPTLVVASSFGAKALSDLLSLHPTMKIPQILMLGPTMDMDAVFKRMLLISEKDLREQLPEVSRRLRECREGSKKFWDSLMQEGLGLAWQNQKLLGHYFKDEAVMALWAGAGSDPHFAIDMNSQVAVLNEMAAMHIPPPPQPLNIPVTVLTGASDPVFNKEEVARELKSVFNNVRFERWEGCGHFPHLEKPNEFIEFAKKLLGSA